MLTPLMVIYEYPYKLVLGPFLVILLAINLALLMKYPSLKSKISGVLILIGLAEALATMSLAFLWGFIIGLATLIIGIFMGVFASLANNPSASRLWAKIHLSQQKTRILRRVAFGFLAITILASALLISARATNIIREQPLETFYGGSSPNLTLRGIIASVALNYEVNTGYSYHIFPAYLTLNVTAVVWSGEPWENQTSAAEYLRHQGSVIIYFEKTDVPTLTVGQQVEVSGYYCQWLEDSLYSNKLVVSPSISESYVKSL